MGGRYDRDLKDIFGLQDEISQKIAMALKASRVVFVTGEVPLPMVVSLFGAGHVPILRKPLTRDQLRRLVERMLT